MRVGLSAGHSTHPDNTPEQRYEHRYCHAVVGHLTRLLPQYNLTPVTPPDSIYELPPRQTLNARARFFNNEPVDVALDLHLNAGGGTYSTVIAYDRDGVLSPGGSKLATPLADALALCYPWRCIGAKGMSYFGRSLGFLRLTHMPAVIVEPGFKDTLSHRALLDDPAGHTLYAIAVVLGLRQYYTQ